MRTRILGSLLVLGIVICAPALAADMTTGSKVITAPEGVAISFTCAPGGSAYNWDFGDGTTLNTANNTVFHTYNTTGNFTVRCTTAINASMPVTVSIAQHGPAAL